MRYEKKKREEGRMEEKDESDMWAPYANREDDEKHDGGGMVLIL